MAAIESKVANKIGYLIFNRPDRLNAFNEEMRVGFSEHLEKLFADPAVSVIVIRGEGRAFSAGNDIEKRGQAERRRSLDDWLALRETLEMFKAAHTGPKPVIASIQGYCLGITTMLAVFCDITIVTEDAVIGWPSLPLGGGLLAPVSAWLIGPKKAKEMSYIIGSRMSGIEAKEWGWANYAVPAAELEDRTNRLANRIAKTPVELLTLKKRAINRVLDTQGFSESVMAGAEFDAIAHDSISNDTSSEKIKELGIKEAIKWFTSDDA